MLNLKTDFGATGNAADDQIVALTNWINALNDKHGEKATSVGHMPRGVYRYTAALPMIDNGVEIGGEGLDAVLFNCSNGPALVMGEIGNTGKGQHVYLHNFGVEGVAASSHGIVLNESHFFRADRVHVMSCGDSGSGWHVNGVISLLTMDCRGNVNVPGSRHWTTSIDNNGGRGTPVRAITAMATDYFTNNAHQWIDFRCNGSINSQAIIYGGSREHHTIKFIGGTVEGIGVGSRALVFTEVWELLIDGMHIQSNGGSGPWGIELTNCVMGAVEHCTCDGLIMQGDTRGCSLEKNTFTDVVEITSTCRVNSVLRNRLLGGFVNNGQNTDFRHNTDNSNLPIP